MYALANIQKFVKDNQERVGDQAEAILKRAEKLSERGIISGGAIEKIFDDPELAAEFETVVQDDLEHVTIGLQVIEKSR